MSVAEIKSILNAKLDTVPEDQLEKFFSSIMNVMENNLPEKIDLDKYVPGIFQKHDELMQKLA